MHSGGNVLSGGGYVCRLWNVQGPFIPSLSHATLRLSEEAMGPFVKRLALGRPQTEGVRKYQGLYSWLLVSI